MPKRRPDHVPHAHLRRLPPGQAEAVDDARRACAATARSPWIRAARPPVGAPTSATILTAAIRARLADAVGRALAAPVEPGTLQLEVPHATP